jgi:hypothetical protein
MLSFHLLDSPPDEVLKQFSCQNLYISCLLHFSHVQPHRSFLDLVTLGDLYM